ncbi:LysR family transcriptional regulator [Streptomyces humi]|uniref:LysR family transcriptional regulator n=1 Tax=Streptomyces humi TaxID=1428620 RepID=UPI00062889AB|nr:LysR family transcriptional regulator [Streptomyces humi]
MRVEQLEYFATVIRLGSLRRAAEDMHLSQPALSESVRNLERELGVELLERRRSGAKISDEGRKLLPHITEVLEAVDRLRRSADTQHYVSRVVRLGTVNAATVPLLLPAVREFRAAHPQRQVEVVTEHQAVIHQGLKEGSLDLGLVSYLHGDDLPADLHTTDLVRGQPVICIRPDSPLAALEAVTVTDLLTEPLIVMRAGYIMHRYVHRLLSGRTPHFSYSTDGAEMSKLMVAEGLGAAVLPDYSVVGDPLERSGAITHRRLADDITEVRTAIQHRRSCALPKAARDLLAVFVRQAAEKNGSQPRTSPH